MRAPQILAVVVRYKTRLEDSQTINGLTAALQDPLIAREVAVLLWDNSPVPLSNPYLPFSFAYEASIENLGTSGAYNGGIAEAERLGAPWLLLLDQDTDVTVDFLRTIIRLSGELSPRSEIGSIVPFIRSEGQIVSPRRFRSFNRSTPVEAEFDGVLQEDAYAVNSASLMRVSALREIGGYSNDFWLDLSDVYAFQQLYRIGKRVYVAGKLELNHAIAGMNFQQDMVPERYETFLAAESAYLERYRSRFENVFQTFWLMLRAVRQYMQYSDKRYAQITFAYLLMRLTKTRQRRLELWQDQLRKRRSIPQAKQAGA